MSGAKDTRTVAFAGPVLLDASDWKLVYECSETMRMSQADVVRALVSFALGHLRQHPEGWKEVAP